MSDVSAIAPATEQTGVANPADAIAAMIAANRRTDPQPEGSTAPPAGQEEAKAESPEAAPNEVAEPEDGNVEAENPTDSEENAEPIEDVSDAINFLEFAEANPDMMWKIPNKDAENGFAELTASKAASILGQGSAIHENARKLKAERAEFEEYEAKRRSELDGLQIGLELTIQPQLQQAADDLIKIQGYNQQWKQILENATDEVQRSEAEAAIRQNNELIQEKSQFIQTNRPKVEQFYQARTEFVRQQLETARQGFSDKELSNKAALLLRIPQVKIPRTLQEKLWAVKYIAAVGIIGAGFYSVDLANDLDELEPFKTAINVYFVRELPFVLYAVALLAAGLCQARPQQRPPIGETACL